MAVSPVRDWWHSAVVYEIYPRSFADTDGDGVGDLAGVLSRIDHLAGLGVDAIWLTPFQRSPQADHGYDVSAYCDVDPLRGDLATFDRLVATAHAYADSTLALYRAAVRLRAALHADTLGSEDP